MRYVIWGLGKLGEMCVDLIGADQVIFIVDKNPKCTTFKGIDVVKSARFYDYYDKQSAVIITPRQFELEIARELDSYGCHNSYFLSSEYHKLLWFYRQFPKEILLADCKNRTTVVLGETILSEAVSEFLLCNGVTVNRRISSESGSDCIIIYDKDERLTEGVYDGVHSGVKWIAYQDYIDDLEIYRNPKLEIFKGVHRDKRCFIVATGPSLRLSDLDILNRNHEICFGVNGVVAAFSQTKWRPDYYMLSDPSAYEMLKKQIYSEKIHNVIISDACCSKLDMPNTYRFHLRYDWVEDDNENLKFSDDFSLVSFWGKTIVYDGPLQMAVYMGFKEIYLIGTDCTIGKDNISDHFYEEKDTSLSKKSHLNIKDITKAYYSAKKYADEHGIRIFNATRGGNLEVFDRVEFDSLFG